MAASPSVASSRPAAETPEKSLQRQCKPPRALQPISAGRHVATSTPDAVPLDGADQAHAMGASVTHA